MARSPSGVRIVVPVAKQLKTMALVGMYVAGPCRQGRDVKHILVIGDNKGDVALKMA